MNNGTQPLNIWLAEELAHAYLVAQTSELRQTDMRDRLDVAIRQLTRVQRERARLGRDLEAAQVANAAFVAELERCRTDNAALGRALTMLTGSNNRYRTAAGSTIRSRTIPPNLMPTIRRIRNETRTARHRARRLFNEDLPDPDNIPDDPDSTDSDPENETP